jgi:hypothetical protein
VCDTKIWPTQNSIKSISVGLTRVQGTLKPSVKLTFHLDLMPSIYIHRQVLRHKGSFALSFMISVLLYACTDVHLTAFPTEKQRLTALPALLSRTTAALMESEMYTKQASSFVSCHQRSVSSRPILREVNMESSVLKEVYSDRGL